MSIEKEIVQYNITSMLKRLINPKNNHGSYEYLNCLERWVLSISSAGVYSIVDEKNQATKKLTEELKEKNIYGLTDQILSIVRNGLKNKPQIFRNDTKPYNNTSKDEQGWIVDIKINNSRDIYIRIPMSKQKYNIFLSHTKDNLTVLFLRYSTLINRGQQWALPQDQFDHLSKKYGVNYEGFASPLNSGLYSIGGSYCSLFKDTDEIFGSLGNFFNQKLYTNLEGDNEIYGRKNNEIKKWIVNPPFIISVLGQTSDKILNDLSIASDLCVDMMVVYIMPSWTDFDGYTKIQNSKYLKHIQNLERKKHFYEHMGKRKVVNSRSTMFVLDTYADEKDYSDIASPMML